MRFTKRRLATTTILVVLGAGAVALAATGPPSNTEISGEMALTRAVIQERLCEGTDEPYSETRAVYYGTSTGDDALTGDVELHIHGVASHLTNLAWDEGTFRIRQPGGGWTSQGRFADASDGEAFKGFIVGETRFPPNAGGTRGRLFANFEVGFEPGRGVLVHMGGEAATQGLPAVQSTGECTGRYETLRVDFTEEVPRALARGPRGIWGG